MRTAILATLAIAVALLCVGPTVAQTPGPNPGVMPIRQIDRAEVRVTRVELQPGAVRSVHTHEDVRFHLFIPITGKIELTIGSEKPVETTPGQAYFMQKGTPHGFRNLGSTPASVMEVFVKEDATHAGRAPGWAADIADAPRIARIADSTSGNILPAR